MPAKFYETTCKYSKLQVAFNHDDHIKKFLGDVRKEHTALPASPPSTGLADVCSAGLEKNLCSFNSFQWRTVVYNRRNCMAAFHLASYLVPLVGSAQTHVPQVFCEPTMASPVHSARLSPNTNVCFKLTRSFRTIALWAFRKAEFMSKSQYTITTLLNRDILNQYVECWYILGTFFELFVGFRMYQFDCTIQWFFWLSLHHFKGLISTGKDLLCNI